MSIGEIARRTGRARNTVKKYLRSDETEPSYPRRVSASKRYPCAEKLATWLGIEAAKSRKQRRTLRQIHRSTQVRWKRPWADGRRQALLQAGVGFVSETVFSHESKLQLVRRAQALGYQVVLYVVSVGDRRRLPNASWMRYPRSMAHLHKAVRLADLTFVYDAAEVERGGHVLVVLCEKEQTPLLVKKPPAWVAALLASA